MVIRKSRLFPDAIHVDTAVHTGELYRRAAVAEFAVEVLTNWEMLLRLESKIALDASVNSPLKNGDFSKI